MLNTVDHSTLIVVVPFDWTSPPDEVLIERPDGIGSQPAIFRRPFGGEFWMECGEVFASCLAMGAPGAVHGASCYLAAPFMSAGTGPPGKVCRHWRHVIRRDVAISLRVPLGGQFRVGLCQAWVV